LRLPGFPHIRHIKVARSSAMRTGRLCPTGSIAVAHFCEGLSRPQRHIAAGTN
jgi:hypothetical protein